MDWKDNVGLVEDQTDIYKNTQYWRVQKKKTCWIVGTRGTTSEHKEQLRDQRQMDKTWAGETRGTNLALERQGQTLDWRNHNMHRTNFRQEEQVMDQREQAAICDIGYLHYAPD